MAVYPAAVCTAYPQVTAALAADEAATYRQQVEGEIVQRESGGSPGSATTVTLAPRQARILYPTALLDHSDVRGLRSLVPLGNFKLDSVAVLESCQTLHAGLVNEHILASVGGSDEPESLRLIEPLHSTLHNDGFS